MSKHHAKLSGYARRQLRKHRSYYFIVQDKRCFHCNKTTELPTSIGYHPDWATLEHVDKISSRPESKKFVMLCMECNSRRVNINN